MNDDESKGRGGRETVMPWSKICFLENFRLAQASHSIFKKLIRDLWIENLADFFPIKKEKKEKKKETNDNYFDVYRSKIRCE